ncbi:GNAT family N-acetyltransferase [Amphritea sp. 2_MG-2023]|uniref:GNAT family N-acetyltransferase n=1 Tax=Amphritea TaxID=515417 RepID=UPI001C067965|nr:MULTISPECIES: GNAT family N-acetyltransferase [Amphritea]MBU2967579.1 GNAT family N-acetyltransferase [Amphritea atlantica]MDO6419067.1 GNAT family N-acetyltransferase [Amphritea sp. 2_MG-2023]
MGIELDSFKIYQVPEGRQPTAEEFEIATKVIGSFRPFMGGEVDQRSLLGKKLNWERFFLIKKGENVVGVLSFYLAKVGPYNLGYLDFSRQFNPVSGLFRFLIYRAVTIRFTYPESYISHFFIRPSARKLGLASQLLEYWLKYMHDHGISHVDLDVYEKNFKAIGLYQKHGFRIKKARKLPLLGRLLPGDSILTLTKSSETTEKQERVIDE